jgi:glucokinase
MAQKNIKVIGVDLGATTTKLAVVDADGQLKSEIKVVDTVKSPDEFMKNLKATIKDLADSDVKAVGLGIPSWDGEKQAIGHSPNMPEYEGLQVGKLLEKEFEELKIIVDNDANVAADGEKQFGGWADGTIVIYTLGTGIGGGVILYIKEQNHYIKWQGDKYRGAELGHVSIPLPSGRGSRFCGCGHLDCFEAHASATAVREEGKKMALMALARGKRSLILDKVKSDKNLASKWITGEPKELVEYIEPLHVNLAAQEGDEIAILLEDQTAQALAYGLRNAVQIFDPTVIVLVGAMRRWERMVQKAEFIYGNLLGVVPYIKIGVSRLENSGILGSAGMAFEAVMNER